MTYVFLGSLDRTPPMTPTVVANGSFLPAVQSDYMTLWLLPMSAVPTAAEFVLTLRKRGFPVFLSALTRTRL